MSSKQATIIYNPMSGRSARRAENVQQMERLLETRGIEAIARTTSGPDDAARLASEAIADGADIIVSYGGDGTLNEVIQSMAGAETALAVWPGGTANVVARELGVPADVERLSEIIAGGRTKRIALGLAKRENGRSPTAMNESDISDSSLVTSRFFAMMAGIGLDASIARGVNKKLKRHTGQFAYWVCGVNHLFSWQPEPFSIEVDGKHFESAFALVGNGKGYGGGITITPGANLEEPWFEVYILPALANNFLYLRALAACFRGKHEIVGAKLVRGSHIKANSAHNPWVEADGELIGPLPMSFEVVPGALSIIVP